MAPERFILPLLMLVLPVYVWAVLEMVTVPEQLRVSPPPTMSAKEAVPAVKPVPPPPRTMTVGAEEYPMPGLVTVMEVMEPLEPTLAMAVAPEPPPPVISRRGGALK